MSSTTLMRCSKRLKLQQIVKTKTDHPQVVYHYINGEDHSPPITTPIMKKLLLTAAAVTVAGIAGLGVFGNHIQNTCVAGNADFEAGTGVCNAKNRAALEAPTAAPKAVEAPKPMTLVTLISQDKNRTLAACEAVVRANLVDPQSFRHVHTDYVKVNESAIAVKLTYSATNAFGGRIQQQQVCGL